MIKKNNFLKSENLDVDDQESSEDKLQKAWITFRPPRANPTS